MPTVSGLQEHFAGRVEFVQLDFDDSSLEETRVKLGIWAQTQYVLVDESGEVVWRWHGILDEDETVAAIEALLVG